MEVVVAGLASEKERAEEAEKLYNYAFAESAERETWQAAGKVLASLARMVRSGRYRSRYGRRWSGHYASYRPEADG